MRNNRVILSIVFVLFVVSLISVVGFAVPEGGACDPNTGLFCDDGLICDGTVCKSSAGSCGDGVCDSNEDYTTCSVDCPTPSSMCGDGNCDSGEYDACPADCQPTVIQCGSNTCAEGDYCANSENGWCCPNGKAICDDGTCVDNFDQCGGSVPSETCGNGICDTGELDTNCPSDCSVSNDPCPDDNCPGVCCSYDPCEWDNCPGYCCSGSTDPCPADTCPGYCCEDNQPTDPNYPEPCPDGQIICDDGRCVDKYDGCGTSSGFCGDNICDGSETSYNCHDDCGKPPEGNIPAGCWVEYNYGKEIVRCETKARCPDDSEMSRAKFDCREANGRDEVKFDGECYYLDCQFGEDDYYKGKRDYENGNVFREMECPTEEMLEQKVNQCIRSNGNPISRMMGGGFSGSGCKVIDCEHRGAGPMMCAEYDNPRIREKFITDCGGIENTVVDIDPQGCPITRCGDPITEGLEEVPSRAYEGCPGELFLERDATTGFVTEFECVFKGGDQYVRVESNDIKRIPDISEVLSLALKLEGMNMKFIELSEKIDDLAIFYRNQAGAASDPELVEKYTLEAKRFEKVSDLMKNAGKQFDSVRDEIREIASKEKITKVDMIQLVTGLKRLKEDTIRQIIFAMLGSADEVAEEYKIDADVEEVGTGNLDDIGTDGWKFDQSFRTCTPVLFKPEGNSGPSVIVKGKNDVGNCVMVIDMTAEMSRETASGDGPPAEFVEFMAEKNGLTLQKNSAGDYIIDMVCEISDYSEGMPMGDGDDGPPTEYFESRCSGLMMEFMKMGPQGGPEGSGERHSECNDGICEEDEKFTCPNDCGSQGAGPDYPPEYYDKPYQEQYDNGPEYYNKGEPDWREDHGPEGYDDYYPDGNPTYPEPNDQNYPEPNDQFPDGGQKCPDGICDEFESQGGVCIEDCGY